MPRILLYLDCKVEVAIKLLLLKTKLIRFLSKERVKILMIFQ